MKKMPRISEAEWEVMKIIWTESPISASKIIHKLAPTATWKPKTIMTLINRLVKKGALGFEKEGRAHIYFPLIDQSVCVKSESRTFIKRVYGGAITPMLVNLMEDAELSKEDIKELKRILEKGEK